MANSPVVTQAASAPAHSRLIVRLLFVLIASAVFAIALELADDLLVPASLSVEWHLAAIVASSLISMSAAILIWRQDQAQRRRAETDRGERDRMAAAQRESEARFEAQYKGFPIPTVTWQLIGDDFVFVDYNGAASDFTQGGIARCMGRSASAVYAGRPDIAADIARCHAERRTFRREMPSPYDNSAAPRTVAATYVSVPPDLVMMHTEDISKTREVETALQRNADAFKLLYEAGLALNSAQEPHMQLVTILGDYMKMLHADRAEFFRYDAATDQLTLAYTLGYPDGVAPDTLPQSLIHQISDSTATALRRRIVNMPDVYNDPNWVSSDPAVRSALFVPVSHDNLLLGVLTVMRTRPNAFSIDDLHLLELAANQVGAIMAGTRLLEQTEYHLRQLQTLHTIDTVILSNLDLDAMLNAILEQTLKQLGADAAAVWLMQSPTALRRAAARGFIDGMAASAITRLGENGAGRVVMERRAVHLPSLSAASADAPQYPRLAGERFVSYYGAPLVSRGEIRGVLELYSRRPLNPAAQWLNDMELLLSQVAIAIDNSTNVMELERMNMELRLAYDDTIEGWSRALDLRDKETEGHTQRVTRLTLQLARSMSLSEAELMYVRWGALLHDIGKMGVPDQVLLKPGPLTPEEWAIMTCHPRYAYEMLAPIAYLRPALDIPYCHHEKWDGSGYPRGLKGEQIPLSARIFAVVDVADALGSNRPYQLAWPPQRVRQYVREQSGRHFDPAVVEAYLALNVNT